MCLSGLSPRAASARLRPHSDPPIEVHKSSESAVSRRRSARVYGYCRSGSRNWTLSPQGSSAGLISTRHRWTELLTDSPPQSLQSQHNTKHIRVMAMHKRILRALGNGPTRRNLFGPVDREQLQAEYRTALRMELEDASRRWSFDFVSEKPLEGGDFQWEGVSGVRVPLLYRVCQDTHHPRTRAKEETSTGQSSVSGTGKENIPRTPERVNLIPQNLEKTPEKRTELKRKQTNITDFYQAKKRLVATPRKSGQ